MIKFYKYGFGRASDYVNEMIRLKTISRDEGIEIVEKYDGVCSENILRIFVNLLVFQIQSFGNVLGPL